MAYVYGTRPMPSTDNIVIGIRLLTVTISKLLIVKLSFKAQLETFQVGDMTPPTILVNTYIRDDSKPQIDFVSKIIMICEIPLGITRLPLIGNIHPIFTLMLVLYSLGMAVFLMPLFRNDEDVYLMDVAIGSTLFQWCFFVIFNLVSIKRLRRYYNELNTFDREVSCTPKMGKGTIRNVIHTIFMISYIIVFAVLPLFIDALNKIYLDCIVVMTSHVFEVHFYGHLLSLLIPRLRLINYFMEMSLSNAKITRYTKVEEFQFTHGSGNKALCKMEKLMNLYHIIIKSYNYLIEAIKWQLLVTIISSFISILCYCYHVSFALIKDSGPISFTASCLGISVGIMLPLFAPCTLGDQVHNEVRRLRELLASRLYEDQLDKSSRGMARALLAWTETRDLSFSLLRMLNIDVSLPFKFVGLLVTYLIILLQFQKVINP